MPEPIVPEPVVTSTATDVPKTKEEWSKLAKDDPGKFAELTQTRMDTIFRQNKEYQEKLAEVETNNKNLALELERVKNQTPAPLPTGEKQYGPGRYPITQEEWDDLFLEKPTFANDLRNMYLNEQNQYKQNFESSREEGVKLVYTEHPDMFIQEMDETGKVKKDGQGKPVLKIDPNTGQPYFKSDTEKGQLWLQIYNEDPKNWDSNKSTPRLIMAEMERRLRVKGANMLKGQGDITDDGKTAVAPEGVPPPKANSGKFSSEEERIRCQQAIVRGVYKNEEEFFKWRDSSNETGYVEPNRRPDFTRK